MSSVRRYTTCFGAALALHGGAWLAGQYALRSDAAYAVAQQEGQVTVDLVEAPPPVITPPPARDEAPPPRLEPIPEPQPVEQEMPAAPEPQPVEQPMPPAPEPSPVPPEPVAPPVMAQPARPQAPAVARIAARSNPAYYQNPPPLYPESARRAGVAGLVLLHVDVGADGRVAAVNIKESSGSALLDRAARDAVRRWRFEPAREGLVAVTDQVDVPIRFSLDTL